ncbi:TrbI/VirB10 family protein [Novosphingobium terrae]|uniref:TrbI/VirB10 family protein n=1 Tax=Novosphingobium terrae TaxID=2726189 RepID=UPI001F12F843|nr:TrbI/VirB10 family protein [Novosphingobium terrae]
MLRGKPRRAVRFRREVIIGMVAAATMIVGGVTWFALSPSMPHINVAASDDTANGAKPNSEVLANAPKNYGDAKLGPPLPGDLGPAILAHQQGTTTVAMSSPPPQADQTLAAEHQRRSEEARAARESGVMVQIVGGDKTGQGVATVTPASASGAGADPAQAQPTARMALDPDHDPGQQQRKADFVSNLDTKGDINPHALTEPTSPYTLSAGTVISASLITGINSDLPGLVSAQVTQNAYDSATGRYLLLPQGSRLIGSYDSVVAYGQKRALLVWQRIILPDGSSVRIDNVPASDASGFAGLADKVDFHSWQLIKGVVLSSLLGVSTQLSFGSNESDLLRAIRESTQQSAGRAGDQIVTRALNVQPTITVRPGWPLRVVVHKDIVMRPWGQQGRP